ncbi:reverse transcriptase domain-containing protein [Tanacetum coccineum]
MRTRSSSHLIAESSTIPKHHNRRRSKQRVELFSLEETPVDTMADQLTMAELLQATTEGYRDAIVILAILAENFELKHGLLNLVTSKQFYGFEKEDPHAHIRWFNKIISMIKYKDVPNSSIKLMLFPFSIEGAAWIWLEKEPPRSILTWEDLFKETFSEAWDHFKDLLRACPHHSFTELHQLDTFYNALNPTDQDSLNAAAGVSANTSSSTMACPSKMATLTNAVKAMLRHAKTSPLETVKAISESCVTCGGPEREDTSRFLVETPPEEENKIEISKLRTKKEGSKLENMWKLYTDGASSSDGSGAGLMLMSPEEKEYMYALQFEFDTMNNEAEYELLLAARQPVIKQYLEKTKEILRGFDTYSMEHIRRNQNKKADALSMLASMTFKHLAKEVLVEVLAKRSIINKEVSIIAAEAEESGMTPIYEYLISGLLPEVPKESEKVIIKAPQYRLIKGNLYKKTFLTPWLRCIGPSQAKSIIEEIHEGSCEFNQSLALW